METADLLVELFVEELPPKALLSLGAAFSSVLAEELQSSGLADPGVLRHFASPRRLAALVPSVHKRAPDGLVSQKLMPVSVGLTASGEATPALLKKLASLGADASAVSQLQRRIDGKSEALFFERLVPGATLAEGLQRALDLALAMLPIPKVMQYQLADGWTSVSFVRPAHGLVALHGREVVPVEALGLRAGRTTRGHRFEAKVPIIEIESASTYESQLRDEGAVVASFEGRRAEIARQLLVAADAAGLVRMDDDALLNEVTALVERPNVLACQFDAEFLDVPPECLVLTMKANQKYFPLLDAQGKLTNRFLVVSNITPADPSRIVEGNERVVRPRLADAKFFFDKDRKETLESRVPGLDKVVYHGKLGSQGERVKRVRRVATWIAERVGAPIACADRAALLAKADLLTDMVGEFPELQGIMGGYYAAHDGEPADVAAAIRNQYVNRRGHSDEPINLVGESLLIADRAETLVGIWSIGLKPTGEKDPYALRRHALTLIDSFERVAAASGGAMRLSIAELLRHVASTFEPPVTDDVVDEVTAFIFDRYVNRLSGQYDVRAINAVVRRRPELHEVVGRVEAVKAFLDLPEAVALAAANKRVGNILKKSSERRAESADRALLVEPAELALANALASADEPARTAYVAGRYADSLKALARLKEPVDAFFESVMVNAESPTVRANRLALLNELSTVMNRVADLDMLAT